jgi:hypothetical protein
MKKVLLLVSSALVMAACGEAPTAPSAATKTPSARAHRDDIFCESGYIIAYDEDGNPICIPDPNGGQNNSMMSGGGSGGSPRGL